MAEILPTSKLLKMGDNFSDVCFFVHVQSEHCVWPQAASPTCKCVPCRLPLFGTRNQIAFFLFTALMQTYQIKSDCATSNIVCVTESRHGGVLQGKKYVSNKCFITYTIWLLFFIAIKAKLESVSHVTK